MAERKESRRFLEHVEENCLTQMVREPSRQGAPWTCCLPAEKGWREVWWLEALSGMIQLLIFGEGAQQNCCLGLPGDRPWPV